MPQIVHLVNGSFPYFGFLFTDADFVPAVLNEGSIPLTLAQSNESIVSIFSISHIDSGIFRIYKDIDRTAFALTDFIVIQHGVYLYGLTTN